MCSALMTPLLQVIGAFHSTQLWSNMSDTQSSIISRCILRCSLMWGSLHSVLWSQSSQDRLVGIHHKDCTEGACELQQGRQSRRISFFTIQRCDLETSDTLRAKKAALQLLFYNAGDISIETRLFCDHISSFGNDANVLSAKDTTPPSP